MILFFIASVQAVHGQKPLVAARIKSVTVSKSPCFGFCPVYTLKVNKKGKVYLHAKDNVAKGLQGKYVTSIDLDTQEKLASVLQEISLTTTETSYGDRNVTDLPATDIAISYCRKKKKTKKVHDYGNKGTPALEKLYVLVTDIVSNANWKATESR